MKRAGALQNVHLSVNRRLCPDHISDSVSVYLPTPGMLASNTLLSQKKSEINMCPNRGYLSAALARAQLIVSPNAAALKSCSERGLPGRTDSATTRGPGVSVHDILKSCWRFQSRNSTTLRWLYAIMS